MTGGAGTADLAGELSGHFTPLDWGVVLGYFAVVTVLGAKLAGRQQTIRDFFLGGRRLPWYAVAGSMLATEISAVTFVGVPGYVFSGGDFRYLLLGVFGSLIARVFVAFVVVPAYYAREIYSPYDYMAGRLGSGVRGMTTALFTVGGVMAQGARVYLTALVLATLLRPQLGELQALTGLSATTWAVLLIGVVSVVWTLLGGIATVVWTDVLLFLVFVGGAAVALGTVVWRLGEGSTGGPSLIGGWGELVTIGHDLERFRFWDFSLDPTTPFTFWTAIFAVAVFNAGQYGTDQLMAQRLFCCRGVAAARAAMLASYLGVAIAGVMLLVGVGLLAFYQQNPPTGEAATLIAAEPDNVFPVFILAELPPGVTGLLIAAILAAAVSSLDSILAALAQTSLAAVWVPWRRRFGWRGLQAAGVSWEAHADADPAEARRAVVASRWLVAFWGVVLCGTAVLVGRFKDATGVPILVLALTLATYTAGPLLAGFLLAFLGVTDGRRRAALGRAYLFAAPLGVLMTFAAAWHTGWAGWVVGIAGALLLGVYAVTTGRRNGFMVVLLKDLAILAIGVIVAGVVWRYGWFDRGGKPVSVAWPWYALIGGGTTLAWSMLQTVGPTRFGRRTGRIV